MLERVVILHLLQVVRAVTALCGASDVTENGSFAELAGTGAASEFSIIVDLTGGAVLVFV